MASGGGGCSASERLPPPFPGMDPESEGAAGGSEPEAGDSDTEGEDIFTGAAAATKPQSPKKTTSLFPIKNGSKENGIHEEQDQEPQDLFADATVELSLDSTQNNQKTMPGKTLISHPPQEATNPPKPQPSYEELEEEEQEDQFDLTVGITDPEKIGDGMNAYVAYKVTTQTSLPMFRSRQFAVKRRFSDFLGLYEKLSEKHSQNGFIVPPPPEKSLIGMTKVKVGKEDSSSAEFLEKRRAALERYLQRIVNHPTMLQDPDVREFLEKEELPRAVGTQALSGAGLLKMFNKATDAVSKMTIKMNESDIWFEEKLQEVECEEQRLRKLHAVVETLVNHRKELALNTALFAKSLAMLGSSEDNTALSRALSQLAEVEEKIEQLHQEQANNDFFLLAELLSDYIRLLAIVRAAFDQRMKTWQRWQDAQATLQKKRESEARLLWANKPDKLQQAKDEITEWESRVTQYERDFERISTVVRKEVTRFEKEKSKDFKNHVIKYLETLLHSQQQVFQVEVLYSGRRHTVPRRYSEFHALHKRIKKRYKVPDFPSKRLPNWRTRGLEQRRQGLETYIQGILYLNQDVPKELLEFLRLRHFPADSKASSWSTMGEFLPSDTSLQLHHRPVLGFRLDPYVYTPFPEPLPEVVVDGVLQGLYGFSTSPAPAQPEANCHPAPSLTP